VYKALRGVMCSLQLLLALTHLVYTLGRMCCHQTCRCSVVGYCTHSVVTGAQSDRLTHSTMLLLLLLLCHCRYDVLVASDAIGMGLNLNIRRVIFHTVVKVHLHSK
jgi:hypothetical protein